MSIIDRFHNSEQSDSQLDAELRRINSQIEYYEQEEQKLSSFKGPIAIKDEAYDRISECIYVLKFKREKLLRIVDKRAARLAKTALSSRENTVK